MLEMPTKYFHESLIKFIEHFSFTENFRQISNYVKENSS